MRKRANLLGGLAALCLTLAIPSFPDKNRESLLEIETGYIGYNNGPITTGEIDLCSVIILDFGDSALLAHALPTKNNLEYEGRYLVTIGNAMDKLIQESKNRDLDYTKSEAIINAGNEEFLRYLTSEISDKGIKIREANTGKAPNPNYARNPLRSLTFSPRDDNLQVSYQQN